MIPSSTGEGTRRVTKLWILVGLALACALGLLLVGEIQQDPGYHNFADRRARWGLPNFGDVASNLPFFLVGVIGLVRAGNAAISAAERIERTYWRVLFGAIIGISIGSATYHLEPTNEGLVWDRLPMAIAFMSLFTLVVHRHIGTRVAARIFPVLLAAAVASIVIWRLGSREGGGDLRLYVFVQFFPIVALPTILVLFPTNRKGTLQLIGALLAYALAKALELGDAVVLETVGVVSGHTLKHLSAALGTWFLVLMMCAGGVQESGGSPQNSCGDPR
ncbi:MAG: hypothetical protein ACI8QS_000855 [Planctomycetota bacterium]|jgi:hypothetical protein